MIIIRRNTSIVQGWGLWWWKISKRRMKSLKIVSQIVFTQGEKGSLMVVILYLSIRVCTPSCILTPSWWRLIAAFSLYSELSGITISAVFSNSLSILVMYFLRIGSCVFHICYWLKNIHRRRYSSIILDTFLSILLPHDSFTFVYFQYAAWRGEVVPNYQHGYAQQFVLSVMFLGNSKQPRIGSRITYGPLAMGYTETTKYGSEVLLRSVCYCVAEPWWVTASCQ